MSRKNPWDDPESRRSIMHGINLAARKRAAKRAEPLTSSHDAQPDLKSDIGTKEMAIP